jgi:hypothetical protein
VMLKTPWSAAFAKTLRIEHLYALAQFLVTPASMLDRMDELEEALSRHEVLQRFKKLLGREMTLRGWQVFFLSDESTLAQENA